MQDPATLALGGPRVLLDGTSSPDHPFLRNLLFWMGLSLMLSGCLCSFVLSICIQDPSAPPVPVATVQQQRRQLTREQVESLLPEYQKLGGGGIEKQHGDYNEDPWASESSLQPSCECSICLDDLLHGDYIRRLPCNHEYHSDCIAKWLIERHSTCPLCKLDLMPEEEDSEGEEEDEEDSIIDHADADRHNIDEDRIQTSILHVLMGSLAFWRRTLEGSSTSIRQEPEISQSVSSQQSASMVDPTPLLHDPAPV